MIKTIKRPISILLAVLMVIGMFTVLPISAGATSPDSGSSGSLDTHTDINATTWTFKLNSNFSGEWNADTDVVSEQPIELTLAAGDYEFQIVAYKNGTLSSYRGNVEAGSFTDTYSQIMYDNGGNAKFHADGGKYTLTYNAGSGLLTINPVYVAEIDGTNYKTLEAAFAEAQDGNTITLLANCAGNGIKAPQGKFANNGLTVDFAGFTYTVDGETVGSTGTETNGFQLLKDNKITFTNGTITSTKAKILVQNYSDLTLEGMTLTLNNPNYDSAYTLSNNNGDVVIDSTTINANPAGGFAFDVCRYASYPSVNVTVQNGSQINGNVEVYASGSDANQGFSLTLESGTINGNIVLDNTAKNAIASTPDKAVITKAATFTQTAPEGYKWDNNGALVPAQYVAQIGSTKYETLEAAFAAANDGETITVLTDCAGNGIKAPQGKFATNGLTVDFAGFTYTVDGETVGSTGTETNGFQLLKGNKITFTNGTITSTKAKILVQNYSNLTLDKMTLTLDKAGYTSAYTLSNNNGDVVIKDTTINANPAGGFAFDVCRFSSYPSVHVTVTGNSQINGDVEISASGNDANQGFSLTLESGTMTGDIVVDASAQALVGEENKVTKKDTFNKTAPAGFKWVSNEDGTSSLAPIPYVAKIGNTKYETLADAFAAAVDGDTITLLANCAGNGIKVTPAGKFADKGLTVDFAGFTYTVDGETVGSTGTETNGFQLLKNNKVTFKNGTITSAKAKILVQNYSDLTLEGMTLTLNNPDYNSAYTLSNNNGNIVIDGTTINANQAGGYAFDVCRFSSYPSVNVTVKGSSQINGDVEISASNGDANQGFSLTLESGTMTGNIVVDASAQALVGENNKVTKADTFTKTAPEGFKWVDNGDGTSTLAPIVYVAEVVSGNNVGTKYETVNDAVAAAGENGEVKLIADITGNVGIGGVLTPYNTTLDLNGHTITNTGGSGITLYSQFTAPATFTIKDSSPEQTGGISITRRYYGDACISDSSGRHVIIEGGNYTSDDKALYISSDEGWTINGGTFNGKIFVKSDVEITDGTFHGEVVQDSTYDYSTSPATEIPAEIAISGGTFDNPVPADFCADGYDPKDNGDGTYTVTPHEHEWDYENVSWTFTENASHSIYAKYTLTCKTDPTHTKEQTGSGTLMSTVAVDGDKFVYSHSAVKIDGISVAVPNYTRNVADGIINRSELVAASKVAGEYKLANDITGFYDSVKPVDGFVLDGQNHMIKYGTMNANNRVMFVAADENTKFTLKNITLDGNNRAKWAVCAYTGNSGNNAGNVITLDTVTIQNFKSNDYVGAINAFGSSTWNLKDCTITGNTTVDDSDGLSGSAVWAGSKATINIDGGTYDEVYLHSYSGTGAVLNADGGATINNLVLDLTKTDTLKANIDDATVGAITANDGFIPEEAVVMDPAKATVAAPEGYQWIDSEETGMKTLGHIHDYTASFNWTQDANGDWDCDTLTLTCSCGDTQDYAATGFFGASAVTCTADANGDFTYTVSKKVNGVTYTDSKTTDANGVINSVKQLKAAAKAGGEWELGKDIDGANDVQCANGFVLDGNNHTVTRSGSVSTQAVFRTTAPAAEITLKNLTIDGIAGQSDSKPAVSSTATGDNTGNTINLVNVDIINYDFDQNNNGTVLAWGHATVNLKDSTVTTDSTYDVWAGAAATVNIDGGNYGTVFLNSNSGSGAAITVDNGANVARINLTADNNKATINGGTVDAITASFEIPAEVVVKNPADTIVDAPEGYVWVDSQTTGMKTLAKAQDLFVGHSITLEGYINLNFYIDTDAIPDYANASSVIAKFTWDNANDHIEVNLKALTPDDANGWVKAYVPVNAAQMANTINAVVEVNGTALAETDAYSVKEYGEEIINGDYSPEAKTLVKEMLNYGAMAQIVFNDQLKDKPTKLANAGLSADDRSAIATEMNNVTSAKIIGAVETTNGHRGATIDDLRAIGEDIGGKWYTTSVIFLDGNTIRHYFDNVNEDPEFAPGTAVQDEWFHYVERRNIAASQLDTLYTFSIGDELFEYSVLDYAAAVVDSGMGDDAKDLAKALYLYNQAANAYFG